MTAQRPSADADSSHNLCLIPHANLTQFNPGLKHAGQVLYKLPEINPAVCSKVKQHLIIIKGVLCINQLHFQLMLADLFLADLKRLSLLLLIPGFYRPVLLCRHTDHRL